MQLILMISAILLLAIIWKVVLLWMNSMPFNADEAVVALMARHILQGERPIFFYGQAYMGSLDAWLVAAGFALFSQHVWVIRLIQGLLYLLIIITTVLIGRVGFGRWRVGLMAALYLAIPSVLISLYTTVSLGGYGEALLIGNLLILMGLLILKRLTGERKVAHLYLTWGFLAGLGVWANALSMVYTLPVGLLLLIRHWQYQRKKIGLYLAVGLAGALLGAMPWVIYGFTQGWNNLFSEMLGSAVAVESNAWLVRIVTHLVSLILLGGTAVLGFRPPWDVRWLALPLAPFVLGFWILVGVSSVRHMQKKQALGDFGWMMVGVFATLSAGFIFTSFGVDPSGRYFLPIAVLLPFAGVWAMERVIKNRLIQWAVLFVLICFNAWGTLQCAFRNPPGITTQFDLTTVVDQSYTPDLIQFLADNQITRGYSNYWVAYPLAFLTSEEMIFVPRLPYHLDLRYTSRDDRIPEYGELVRTAGNVAFITTNNPALDAQLVAGLENAGIIWNTKQIGDYRVYYDLSQPITPEELGIVER